jgi:uncharacterized protein with HEPN domain
MSRKSYLYVTDMLNSVNAILEYTENMSLSEFKADQKTIDAVIRNF